MINLFEDGEKDYSEIGHPKISVGGTVFLLGQI